MLQYLVILLDDTSVSYCHYDNRKTEHRLINLDILKNGIFWAMKENLMIQFVYPSYKLPTEYQEVINSIDHINIVPSLCDDQTLMDISDVVVINDWKSVNNYQFMEDTSYVLRTLKSELFDNYQLLIPILEKVNRLNIIITDVEYFTKEDFGRYKDVLSSLSRSIENIYVSGKAPQLNILTDRMMLDNMNNCDAGWKNITLAPDGKFYVCPAFYHMKTIDGSENSLLEICEKGFNIGDLQSGLNIKNSQLYILNNAPLCRNCDAYQCKRCVWINRKTTCEVNIPSHEQCVVAHLERNASRNLMNNIRKHGQFLLGKAEIKEINYLDPLEIKEQW